MIATLVGATCPITALAALIWTAVIIRRSNRSKP